MRVQIFRDIYADSIGVHNSDGSNPLLYARGDICKVGDTGRDINHSAAVYLPDQSDYWYLKHGEDYVLLPDEPAETIFAYEIDLRDGGTEYGLVKADSLDEAQTKVRTRASEMDAKTSDVYPINELDFDRFGIFVMNIT